MGHVDTKAVDATIEPEAHDRFRFRPYFVVVPVEVRLRDIEDMQVPLTQPTVCLGDPRPARAAEIAEPVVRRQLPGSTLTVAKYVPRSLAAARCCPQGGLEPRMFAGGMVRYEIDDDPDAVVMSGRDELVRVLEPPEYRIDIA